MINEIKSQRCSGRVNINIFLEGLATWMFLYKNSSQGVGLDTEGLKIPSYASQTTETQLFAVVCNHGLFLIYFFSLFLFRVVKPASLDVSHCYHYANLSSNHISQAYPPNVNAISHRRPNTFESSYLIIPKDNNNPPQFHKTLLTKIFLEE